MKSGKLEQDSELSHTFEPLRVCFALFALLFGIIACARADEPGTGELHVHLADGTERTVASLKTDVEFHVAGMIAEVSVHQHFRNDGNAWLESSYVLPLPEGAAVYDMKLHIGNRVIVGEIREKQQAQAEYTAALQQGKKASLLEQASGNLFHTSVANVAPGEAVEIEVKYWQRVDYRDGQFSLTFPLTYTERYLRQQGADSEQPSTTLAKEEANFLANKTAFSTNAPKVSIVVELNPGLPLEQIESTTHPLEIQQSGEHYRLMLQEKETPANRDFVLTWKPKVQVAPVTALFTEKQGNDNYALVMVMPQQQVTDSMPRELILVIDTSGSMLGTSMEQAKAAATFALNSLDAKDRFNVIEFNSVTKSLFDEAVPATDQDLKLAREWVASLRAEGGTEMYPALEKALSGKAPEGFVRQVVFATDGAVSDEAGLLALIEQKLGSSRLFPVGIGSAPNGHFITKAAERGRGSELVIRDINEVGEKIQLLLNKLAHPALRDLQMNWPTNAETYPQQLPDLYLGEPLLVVTRVPNLAGKVKASGWLANADWSQTLSLEQHGMAQGIARLWARQKIDDLEDSLQRGAKEEEVRKKIIEIGIEHHLVSRYTSLVAVDKTPIRPENAEVENAQIANGIPAGQLAYAQTATPATIKLLLGVLLLLSAFMLYRKAQDRSLIPI